MAAIAIWRRFRVVTAILLLFAAMPLIPVWIILKRVRYPPALSRLDIILLVPLIGLCLLPFQRPAGAAGSNVEVR